MDEPVKQLLIIGNGFDLASGLKSSYSDFFNYLMDKYNTSVEKIKYSIDQLNTLYENDSSFQKMIFFESSGSPQYEVLKKMNLWILLFVCSSLNEKSDWQNIEAQIQLFLESGIFYGECIKTLDSFNCNHNVLLYRFKIKSQEQRAVLKPIEPLLQVRLTETTLSLDNNLRPLQVAKFLLKELDKLEQEFEKFLFDKSGYSLDGNSSLSGRVNNKYEEKSAKLLFLLLADLVSLDFTDPNFSIEKVKYFSSQIAFEHNLLNFNYTTPWKIFKQTHKLSYEGLLPTKSNNVHGEAIPKNDGVGRIIFGIDSQEISASRPEYLFTKSFRCLVNQSDTRVNLYPIVLPIESDYEDREIEQSSNVFDSQIKIIKFFGHSLGEADYSYFMQMFDTFDLYNSDVILVFYFSCYDTRDRIEHLFEQTQRVTKLIEKYGESLSNENHGKNLLQKLEITKRIYIRELPSLINS